MDDPSITNGEKLKQLMQDEEIRKKFEESLQKNGHVNQPPILTLAILANDGSEYELEEDDIREVFSRFGNVEKVVIRPNAKALIVFSHVVNAAFALTSLNNHIIEDIEIQLKVNWCPIVEIPQDLLSTFKNPEIPNNQSSNENFIKEIANFDIKNCDKFEEINRSGGGNFNPPQTQDLEFSGNIKYTCRFEIQIENEREFQVCRKIIGPKGSNMKQIIEFCCQDRLGDFSYFQEQIKLRLRGKGSGYKEGINQMESEDNLHLCVSSRDYEMYSKACSLIERLLSAIYDEFKLYCMRTGKPFDPNLKIQKQESTTSGNGNNFFMEQPMPNQNYHGFFNQIPQSNFYPPPPPPQQNFYQPYHTEMHGYDMNQNFYPQNKNVYIDSNKSNTQEIPLNEETITRLIEARNKARKELNFKEADRIRNFLKYKGIALMDEKGARGKGLDVTSWKYIKPNFETDFNASSSSNNNNNNNLNTTPQKQFG